MSSTTMVPAGDRSPEQREAQKHRAAAADITAHPRFAEYLTLFVQESHARLAEMWVDLSASGTPGPLLQKTQHGAHQIAGSAAMAGCPGIASFALAVEAFVERIQEGRLPFGSSQRDILHQVIGALSLALERASRGHLAVRPEPTLQSLLEAWAAPPEAR